MKNFEGTMEKKCREWLGKEISDKLNTDQICELRAQTYRAYSDLVIKFGKDAAKAYGADQVCRDLANQFI